MERNSPPPSHPASRFFYNLSLILTGGLVITGLLIGSGVLRDGASLVGGLRRLVSSPIQESEPQVDVQSIVIQQVQGMSELTTAKFSMQAVVPAQRDRTFAGYTVGTTTLLYIAYGEVRAGIDLSQLTRESVQVMEDGALTIQLPPPQILDSKIDVNRSQVYDYDRGFLGLGPDAAPELQQLAQQETLQQVVTAACAEGILQEANTRAELAIRQLLTTTGYSAVTVITQPPPPGACAVVAPPVTPGETTAPAIAPTTAAPSPMQQAPTTPTVPQAPVDAAVPQAGPNQAPLPAEPLPAILPPNPLPQATPTSPLG